VTGVQIHWHLNENEFFDGLPEEKKLFLALSVRHEFRKRDFIFLEGDPGDVCFWLERGLVKIFRSSLAGKEPTFFLRRAGEMFGLAEVMDGNPRKCNAQALSSCTVFSIGKIDFEGLLSEHYPLTRRVITALGRRLRYLGEQVENLMVCDVATRILKLLVYLSYDKLIDNSVLEKPVIVPFNLTQEQLAAMTGSCQQTISETLKKLQEEGLIILTKKEITILRPSDILDLVSH